MSILSSPRGRDSVKGTGNIPGTLSGDMKDPTFALPFQHRLIVPKSTPVTTPYSYILSLPIGKINRLWVEMPEGCKGLVGVQVWRRVRQIFPLPEGEWYLSDDTTVSFAFTHLISNEPYEIEIRGYNLDDTYEHKPWIAFEMTGLNKDLSPQMQGLLEYLQGG